MRLDQTESPSSRGPRGSPGAHRLGGEEDDTARAHDVVQAAQHGEVVGAVVEALEEHRGVEQLGAASNPSMSPGTTPQLARARRSARVMERQNFSSSSTAVTSRPVATRSLVRLPQPGPNSTTRRRRRAAPAREHAARQSRRWPRATRSPAHERQRAGLVGEGPLERLRQVEGGCLVGGLVSGPPRDRAVQIPGPLPVGLGERVVRRCRRGGPPPCPRAGPGPRPARAA